MRDLLAFGHSQRQQRPSPLLRTMVGSVLRRTRLSQGRTLADVAAAARISMQYLSELERGRKEASSEILAALCSALRLDLSDLLAAVGHDLLSHRAGRPRLVRFDALREGGLALADPDAPLPDDPSSLAEHSLAGNDAADSVTPARSAAGGSRAGADLGSRPRGAGDAVCLLAA
jgi:transcriptional regulator with XRE-family HTH domain